MDRGGNYLVGQGGFTSAEGKLSGWRGYGYGK